MLHITFKIIFSVSIFRMERTLKIYKASAGSGKTFTLALEYIKLLVENPYSYRNILAVTFTNKATGEMKERILSKLYGVANRSKSAKDYMKKIRQELPDLSENEIISNAQKALNLILHDYGHFRIQTIDAFFQTVLRSVAKELDLKGDMEISLDGNELLDEAVDTYIKGLEPETTKLTQVINFIEDRIDNGSDWRVTKELKEFAKNILKEEYQQRGEELREQIELNNGVLLKEFYNSITTYRRSIKEKTKALGDKFMAYATGYTANDFAGKSRGIYPFFEKVRNGDTPSLSASNLALADNPEKISKSCNNDEIAQLIRKYPPLLTELNNCELSLKHYHQLGMLNGIAATLKEENHRENRFLLAETTHLLSSMIGKNTTFIFEKIGTEIEHIFIDEFQDTSKLQWTCFKVLLEEILARGNFNLIVGDVKQSIYRWRNSDWNIMNNIGSHFRDDMITFAKQDVTHGEIKYSSTNFRSDSNIVTFNNLLYRNATKWIGETYETMLGAKRLGELKTAYSDVEQAVPEDKKSNCGYAEIRVIEKSDKKDNFKNYAIKQLMETLHHLLDVEKLEPGNITILLRYKNVMPDIVEAFNAEDFKGVKIVSDEAYRLSSSLVLRLVIAAMRYIASPENKVNIANLVRLYKKVILKQDDAFEDFLSGEEMIKMLPEAFRTSLYHLQGLPVYELIEQLLLLLDVSKSKEDEAFIYAFLDHATQYLRSKSSDLNSFLDAWEENICEKSIPAENNNSVRIMTIHKSKGLEFHTVIIPFCDWILTGDTRNSLWCEPKGEPFDKLSLISVPMSKDMLDSIYSDEYNKEYLYQIVDNLNILYVATTRAKSNLFIFTDASNGRGETVSKMMNNITESMLSLQGAKYEDGIFTFGSIVRNEEKKGEEEKKDDNPFESTSTPLKQPFVYYDNRITFKQSRELARFLTTDKEMKKKEKNILQGELMHLVMSGIKVKEDLEQVLKKMMIEGFLATESQYNHIKQLVEWALANPKVQDWFSGKYKLYNECTILISNNEEKTRRPDRVMINGDEAIVVDYKFGHEDKKYDEQVNRYMELLLQMGYTNVKGYLWYVYKNEINEV